MRKRKIWRIRPADPALIYIFQHELRVSPVMARLLVNRGITTVEEAGQFLKGSLESMHDPFMMSDMERAVRRIREALEHQEKILVYGDYDADGVTATALLIKLFKKLGGQAGYYVPHRIEDGYGLHSEVLRKAGQDGCSLVVTVDCGISALEEVALNRRENGPDIIITDHHEPPQQIPEALAVLNPKRPDCPYPYKELAGVGVALKLAQALLGDWDRETGEWTEYLYLACLGTVADIVPLTGENRIIVKYGLTALAGADNPGINALMDVTGVKPDRLDTREVGFVLAPRLNAAGRIGDAGLAVDLLLTGDPGEAGEMASLLHRDNQERQRIESLVLAEAMGMLDADPALRDGRVIVLASPGWHPGVVGIVASRLVERYCRPVLLIALDGNEGKGSGRSVPGFHLYNALCRHADLLVKYGGHAQAAGFSIEAGKIDAFRAAINEYAEEIYPGEVFEPEIELDASVSLQDVSEGLVKEIEMLAPFGHCNPGPLLACREATVLSCREIGRNKEHLKLLLKENGAVMDGVAFNLASGLEEIAAASEVDVVFLPSINTWKGRQSLQLEVKDIRPAVVEGADNRVKEPRAGNAGETGRSIPGALGSLKRIGPLAHLPEYVSLSLLKYGEASQNFIFPGSYLEFFSGGLPVQVNQTGDCLRMLNNRHTVYKPAALYNLACDQKHILVLVSSPARAVELAVFLVHSGVGAGFLHSGVEADGVDELQQKFDSGDIGVLISTYRAFQRITIKPRCTVFFDLPFSPREAGPALSNGSGRHVLFSREDVEAGMEYLESMAPGRDRLLDLYSMVRVARKGYIDPVKIAGVLRRRGLNRAGLHTLAFGLAVFSDLGLIHCTPEGNGYRVTNNPVRKKTDLNLSATFCTGQELKMHTEKWWGSLVADAAKIS